MEINPHNTEKILLEIIEELGGSCFATEIYNRVRERGYNNWPDFKYMIWFLNNTKLHVANDLKIWLMETWQKQQAQIEE